MARYAERAIGVYDTQVDAPVLPHTDAWAEYLAWLSEGNVPDAMPPPELPALALRTEWANQAVNELRIAKLASAVVSFNGYQWDADSKSLQNLIAAVVGVSAGIPLPEGFVWRTADNQSVPVGITELVGIGAAIQNKILAIYSESWRLKDQVIAGSQNPEQLDIPALWQD